MLEHRIHDGHAGVCIREGQCLRGALDHVHSGLERLDADPGSSGGLDHRAQRTDPAADVHRPPSTRQGLQRIGRLIYPDCAVGELIPQPQTANPAPVQKP